MTTRRITFPFQIRQTEDNAVEFEVVLNDSKLGPVTPEVNLDNAVSVQRTWGLNDRDTERLHQELERHALSELLKNCLILS